jgi:hypothetical protein
MTDAGGCGNAVPVGATGGEFALASAQIAFLASLSTALMARMAARGIGEPTPIPVGAIATEPRTSLQDGARRPSVLRAPRHLLSSPGSPDCACSTSNARRSTGSNIANRSLLAGPRGGGAARMGQPND